jgi:hypothetical protein
MGQLMLMNLLAQADFEFEGDFDQTASPEMGLFGGIVGLICVLFVLVISIVIIAGVWKTYSKAGQPGWACIIPIYHLIVMLEIAGRPLWWFFLFLIPGVNLVIGIIVCMDIARNFGKSPGFGVGLALLSFIFFPILGFGDARYQPVPV